MRPWTPPSATPRSRAPPSCKPSRNASPPASSPSDEAGGRGRNHEKHENTRKGGSLSPWVEGEIEANSRRVSPIARCLATGHPDPHATSLPFVHFRVFRGS